MLKIKGGLVVQHLQVSLLAIHTADRHLCIFAVVVCWFVAQKAPSLLAPVASALPAPLLHLRQHRPHYQPHVVLHRFVLSLFLRQFGHLLWIKFRVEVHEKWRDRSFGQPKHPNQPIIAVRLELLVDVLRKSYFWIGGKSTGMDVEVQLKKGQVRFFDGVYQFDNRVGVIFDEGSQSFRQSFV